MRLIIYNNALVSFASPDDILSIHLMEKIGLKRNSNVDFPHPKFHPDHKLPHHVSVLYKLKADECLRGDINEH
jgi:hypothetical protein